MHFVALGHVTNDLIRSPGGAAEGKLAPGGSALYAALAAAHLGARATIVTSCGEDFTGTEVLEQAGVELLAIPAEATTCFENRYDAAGARTQRVLARAGDLTDIAASGDIVFACPVIGEVTDTALHYPAEVLVGAGLQGWLRATDELGHVRASGLGQTRVLEEASVVFVSRDDIGGDEAALERIVNGSALVVYTLGEGGCELHENGMRQRVFAHPTKQVDPTGAGDVFATAFLIGAARGMPPTEAAMFGCCAASVVIEAIGASALHRLGEIDRRMAWYQRNVASPIAC